MFKNLVHLIPIISLLGYSGGCARDNHDLSVLCGPWETTSLLFTEYYSLFDYED